MRAVSPAVRGRGRARGRGRGRGRGRDNEIPQCNNVDSALTETFSLSSSQDDLFIQRPKMKLMIPHQITVIGVGFAPRPGPGHLCPD